MRVKLWQNSTIEAGLQMKPSSPRGIKRMIGRKQKKNKPVPRWMQVELAEATLKKSGVAKMKCEMKPDETCVRLYCPRHAGRLAYCPWEKN